MAGVTGYIGGTHIPFQGPGGIDEEFYQCRERYDSVNVQGIYDSDLTFLRNVAS